MGVKNTRFFILYLNVLPKRLPTSAFLRPGTTVKRKWQTEEKSRIIFKTKERAAGGPCSQGDRDMINQKLYEIGTEPSVIRALFAYGLEKAKEIGGENVYDYSLGNPSIPAPEKVNETIRCLTESVDSLSLHGYSMAAGFESVRKTVADILSRRFSFPIRGRDLFFTCGAAPALISVIKALAAEASSEIIAIAPYFSEYKYFVENNGAAFKVVPPDVEAFQVNYEALSAAIGEHTQAVIVNSPNNPSGVVYTEQTLRKIGAILKEKEEQYGHPVYIIADEPYRELVYGEVTVPFIPAIYENTVVCYSYSKSLSLPGERIGYVYIPQNCADSEVLMAAVSGAARIMGHVCPPSLFQRVVEECADEKPDLKAYEENRNLLYNSLTEMGYECAKPDGAFYLFVKAPNGDDRAFSEKAKLGYNLLVVPGAEFGCPGFLRLAYCVSNDMIRRSLPAFEKILKDYSEEG